MLALTPDGSESFDALASECFTLSEACAAGRVALVVGDEVIWAPTIQEPSFGPELTITGSLSEQQADQLARLIEFAAIPAAYEIVSVTFSDS